MAYALIGNYEQAITNLDQSIKLNPTLSEAYYNRGNVYYVIGNYPSALEDYLMAQSLGHTSDNLGVLITELQGYQANN